MDFGLLTEKSSSKLRLRVGQYEYTLRMILTIFRLIYLDCRYIFKLDSEEKEPLEVPFTLEECKKVLETFEDNKSLYEDGLTAEFFKHFFDLIGTDLIKSLNQSFEDGELSISQRRGIHMEFCIQHRLVCLVLGRLSVVLSKTEELCQI